MVIKVTGYKRMGTLNIEPGIHAAYRMGAFIDTVGRSLRYYPGRLFPVLTWSALLVAHSFT